jgi:hypothetical protein
MILGAVTIPCGLDCQHWIIGIIVAFCGLGLLLTAILDRWLGDAKPPNVER